MSVESNQVIKDCSSWLNTTVSAYVGLSTVKAKKANKNTEQRLLPPGEISF